MESIQRSLMLLKPGKSNMIEPGKNTATLKLNAGRDGLVLSLNTDCLKTGEYSVYLFLSDGNERYVGSLKDGRLNATLYDTRLENISGAAVVHSDNGNHTFCLKSTGMDWPEIIERFKIQRNTNSVQKSPQLKQPYSVTKPEDITLKDVEKISLQERQSKESAFFNNVSNADISNKDLSYADDSNFAENICDTCPHVIKQDKINPFPTVYPNSEWVKISYPGPTGWWHYISGKLFKGNALTAKVLGVPGEYGLAPPIWLEGFGTYMRCVTADAKGYWLMFQDAKTGEVLDPGLSPHDV